MWYILQVDTGREAFIKENLKRLMPQGLLKDVFFPLYETTYRKKGIRSLRTSLLFPGYLFLDVEEERREELERSLERVTKCHCLPGVGKVCCPVGREERTFLLRHMNPRRILPMSRGSMRGREVRITEGAFAGYCGELKYVDRHNRYGVMAVKLGERDVDMGFGLEIVEKVF